MKVGGLALGIACIARIAHADPPPIGGHVALGPRISSTTESRYGQVGNDTGPVRAAAEGLVGLRIGPALVGLHGGLATPLSFGESPIADSGEIVTEANSTIYPFDLGLGAQLDAGSGVWLAAWVGATVSFWHADSPAMHISAIDFTGDIPAASWSGHATGLGYGVAMGYDLGTNDHLAAVATFDSQAIAEIPSRSNNGGTGAGNFDISCRSLTLGIAYRY